MSFSIGDFRATVVLDTRQFESGVKKTTDGLDKVEKATEKTGKTAEQLHAQMKKALAAEVVSQMASQLAGALGRAGLTGAAAGAATAVEAMGRSFQAAMASGNLMAGALAGATTIVSQAIEEYVKIKQVIEDAQATAAAGHAAMAAEAEKQRIALRGVNDEIAAMQAAARNKTTVTLELAKMEQGSKIIEAVEARGAAARLRNAGASPAAIQAQEERATLAEERGKYLYGVIQREELGLKLGKGGGAKSRAAGERYGSTPAEMRAFIAAAQGRIGTAGGGWAGGAAFKAEEDARFEAARTAAYIAAEEADRAASARELDKAWSDALDRSEAAAAAVATMSDALSAVGTDLLRGAGGGGLLDLVKSARDLYASSATLTSGAAGDTGTSVFSSAAAGDLGGAAVGILASSKQGKQILGIVGDLFQSLADSLGAFLEPLIPLIGVVSMLGQSLGALVASFSGFLEPAAIALFEAVKYVAAVVNVIAASLQWVITAASNGILEMGIKILEWINSVWETDAVTETIAAMQASQKPLDSFSDTVSDAWSKFADLTYPQMKKFGLTMAEINESTTNLPQGFKLAAARFAADTGQSSGGGGGPGRTHGAQRHKASEGAPQVNVAAVYIDGKQRTGEQIWAEMTEKSAGVALALFGNPIATGTGSL